VIFSVYPDYKEQVYSLEGPGNQKFARLLFNGYNNYGIQRQVVLWELTQNG